MGLKFINRRGATVQGALLPELVTLVDERFAALEESKGKLYAETAYFLFMFRLHITLQRDGKLADASASHAARYTETVLREFYKDDADAKLEELMGDVDRITGETMVGVVDRAKAMMDNLRSQFGDKKEGEADHA